MNVKDPSQRLVTVTVGIFFGWLALIGLGFIFVVVGSEPDSESHDNCADALAYFLEFIGLGLICFGLAWIGSCVTFITSLVRVRLFFRRPILILVAVMSLLYLLLGSWVFISMIIE